jgi:hypothetical protein
MRTKTSLRFLLLLALYSCNDIPQHITTGLEGNPLPAIDLLLPDSITHINTKDASKGTPTVLMYVDPDCRFCRAQLTELKSKISQLHNIQFYIFTETSIARTRRLEKSLPINGFRNLYLGIDTQNTFVSMFNPPGYPYTAVYRVDRKLHAVFLGQTDLTRIEKAATD